MNKLKKIITEISILIIDVFLFAYIGVIERLDGFEHGVFRMATLLRKKYIKQSLLVIASLLFLLSSLEWTKEKAFNNSNTNRTQQVSNNGTSKEPVGKYAEITGFSKGTSQLSDFTVYKNILQSKSNTPLPSSVKTYLLIRNLRI